MHTKNMYVYVNINEYIRYTRETTTSVQTHVYIYIYIYIYVSNIHICL